MTMTDIPSMLTSDTFGQRARAALQAMSRHKPEIPASWSNADALYAETLKIRHEQPPVFPGIPTSAAKAGASIDAHAKAIAVHRDRQLAAKDAGEYAQRTLSLELDRALGDWYGMLAEKFAEAAAEFTSITLTSLSGYESDDDMREYARKKRAASELHQLQWERIYLADALNESPGAETKVWVIAAPPTRPASVSAAAEARQEARARGVPLPVQTDADMAELGVFSESVKRWVDLERWWPTHFVNLQPFERFQSLADKGVPLKLAEGGQIQDRQEAFGWLKNEFGGGTPTMTGLGQETYQRERLHLPVAA
jgi:hypothetical protein